MNILYTAILFCALTALLTYIGGRNQARSRRGVTNIRRRTYWKNDTPLEEVVIRYRTDRGKSGKLRPDSWNFGKLHQQPAVGDTFLKAPGEYMPKRASAPTKPF